MMIISVILLVSEKKVYGKGSSTIFLNQFVIVANLAIVRGK